MFKKIRNFIMSLFYKEKRIPRDDSEKRSNFIGVQSSNKNDKNTLRVEQHPGFTRVTNLSPSASPALLHSPKLSDAEYQARRRELMGVKLNEDGTDPAINTGYENRQPLKFTAIEKENDGFRRGTHTVTSEPISPNELDIDMSKFAEVAEAVIVDQFREALINGHSGHPVLAPETDIHIGQVKTIKARFEDLSKNEKRKMSPRRIKKESKKVIKPIVGKHR